MISQTFLKIILRCTITTSVITTSGCASVIEDMREYDPTGGFLMIPVLMIAAPITIAEAILEEPKILGMMATGAAAGYIASESDRDVSESVGAAMTTYDAEVMHPDQKQEIYANYSEDRAQQLNMAANAQMNAALDPSTPVDQQSEHLKNSVQSSQGAVAAQQSATAWRAEEASTESEEWDGDFAHESEPGACLLRQEHFVNSYYRFRNVCDQNVRIDFTCSSGYEPAISFFYANPGDYGYAECRGEDDVVEFQSASYRS